MQLLQQIIITKSKNEFITIKSQFGLQICLRIWCPNGKMKISSLISLLNLYRGRLVYMTNCFEPEAWLRIISKYIEVILRPVVGMIEPILRHQHLLPSFEGICCEFSILTPRLCVFFCSTIWGLWDGAHNTYIIWL